MIRVACVGITVWIASITWKGYRRRAVNTWRELYGSWWRASGDGSGCGGKAGAQVDFIGRVGDDDTGNSLLQSWNPGALTPVTPNGITRRIFAIRHHGGYQRRADNH